MSSSSSTIHRQPASIPSPLFTQAKDTSELLDKAVAADEEQRALDISELPEVPAEDMGSAVYPTLMTAWTKIIETWKAERAEQARKKYFSSSNENNNNKSNSTNENEPTSQEEKNRVHKQEETTSIDEPSFRRAAFAVCSKEIIGAVIARFFQEAATIGLAFLVRQLVEWLNKSDAEVEGDDQWQGFVWATAILLCQLTMLSSQALSVGLTYRGLKKVQAAVITAVFEKSLKLRPDLLQKQKGQIITLHSSESNALRFNPMLASVFTAVPALIAIVISLYFIAGVSALAAVGVTIIFAILQNIVTRKMSAFRGEYLKKTDIRLNKMTEMIAGIKLVFLMSWQNSFEERVSELRADEVSSLTQFYAYRSVIITLSHWMPPLLTLTVFGIYSRLNDGNQDPAVVFSTLVLLNVLRTSLTSFSMALAKTMDLLVSLDRYGKFLRLNERITYIENIIDNDANSQRENCIEFDHALSAGFYTKNDPRKKTENQNEKSPTKTLVSEKFFHAIKEVSKIPGEENHATQQDNDEKVFFVPILHEIKLSIKKNRDKLVFILGSTASGRTSLINLLIGAAEIDPDHFSSTKKPVKLFGRIALSQQDPWIMNRTIKENIIADQEFDSKRYASALVNACLLEDLKAFAGGDDQVVGEKGVVTSGGQKSRISLARLLYSDSDINFLDDVLSSVDAHVGKSIAKHCILGALKNKTRICVVQQHFDVLLPKSDRIIAMKEQEIAFDGSYSDFSRWSKETNYTAVAHHDHQESSGSSSSSDEETEEQRLDGEAREDLINTVKENIERAIREKKSYFGDSHKKEKQNEADVAATTVKDGDDEKEGDDNNNNNNNNNNNKPSKGNLVSKEGVQSGTVSWRIYAYYCGCAGVGVTVFIHLSFAAWRVAHLISDFILSLWTTKSDGFGRSFTNDEYLRYFIIAASGTFVAVALRQISYTWGLFRVAHTIHHRVLSRLLKAPMSFYETNPLGRIQNRISSDMSQVDQNVAEELMFSTSLFYLIVSQVITMLIGAIYMLPVVLFIAALFHFARVKYATALRNVRRLDNVSKSPVLSIMSETVDGLKTILLFRQLEAVTRRHTSALASLLKCSESYTLVQEFINFRVAILGSTVVGSFSFLIVVLRIFSSSAGGGVTLGTSVMSLALSYAIALATSLSYFIVVVSQCDSTMSCVERIREYAEDLEQEREVIYDDDDDENNEDENEKEMTEKVSIPNNHDDGNNIISNNNVSHHPPLPKNWPLGAKDGSIEFKNVHFRYRPELPLVLKGVSFIAHRGERCALVGASGNGKSTVLTTLFRLAEIEDANGSQILIDGRDTKTIKLEDLRSQIGILPQDSLLYSGTVRSNLDPFNHCSDEDIWDALELIGMKDRLGVSSSNNDNGASSSPRTSKSKNDGSTDDDNKNNNNAGTGLDTPVRNGGSNFSAGEKQKICLCRQLLRKTPILCLDEATSSTDAATDSLMQKILREKFKDCTILTIAHRLLSIADYDRVLVLSGGQVAESDKPHLLLQNEDTLFSKMVQVLSVNEQNMIRKLAKEHFEKTSSK